jgi:hypothetical protein
MPGAGRREAARGARNRQRIVVLVAALALLTFACAAAIQVMSAGDVRAARLLGDVPLAQSPSPIGTPTTTGPTATPKATQPGRKPTPTPTRTPARQPTATPVPPGNSGGGGGAPGGGGSPSGPQPTKVVLSQPTVGASNGGALQGLNPASNGANGVWIASLLGCVTAVLGILVAATALSVLVRGGYGPYLRIMLLGARAGKRGDAGRALARARGRSRVDDEWDSSAYTFDRASRFDDELPRRGPGGLWQDRREDEYDDYSHSRVRQSQSRNDRPSPQYPRSAPRGRGGSWANW